MYMNYYIYLMMILLNGNAHILPDGTSLDSAIAHFFAKPEHIIAEVNGVIIPRNLWSATTLVAESRVELITFVGGG